MILWVYNLFEKIEYLYKERNLNVRIYLIDIGVVFNVSFFLVIGN